MPRQSSRNAIDAFLFRSIRPGSMVLDVGCGYGETALAIARQVPRVSIEAVDTHAPSVARARKRFRRSRCRASLRASRVDVIDLTHQFPQARFDAVICNNAFHELWPPVRSLRQIRAVLKPRGILLLAELTPRAGEAVDDCPRYSREKLLELLRRAGFSGGASGAHPGVILIRAVRR